MATADLEEARRQAARAMALEELLELLNATDVNEAYLGFLLLVQNSDRSKRGGSKRGEAGKEDGRNSNSEKSKDDQDSEKEVDGQVSDEVVLADLYLNSSPQCNELFTWWDDLIQGKAHPPKGKEYSFSAALLNAFAAVLYNPTSSRDYVGRSAGEKQVNAFAATRQFIARRILSEKMGFITKLLKTSTDHRVVKCILKLLTCLADCGAAACRVLTHRIDFNTPGMQKWVNRLNVNCDEAYTDHITDDKGRFGSARHRCLQLVSAILRHGDVNVKKKLIEPNGFAQTTLRLLAGDPKDMSLPLLEAVRSHVVRDLRIGRVSQMRFFRPEFSLAEGLLPLYGSAHEEVRTLGHALLQEILFDRKYAIFPMRDPKEYQDTPNGSFAPDKQIQKCVELLTAKLFPVSDDLQRDLFFRILESRGPTASANFLYSEGFNRLMRAPLGSFDWLKNSALILRLLKMSMPDDSLLEMELLRDDAENEYNLGQRSLSTHRWNGLRIAFFARTLPYQDFLSKATLHRGISHASSLVVVQTLDIIVQLLERVHRQLRVECERVSKQSKLEHGAAGQQLSKHLVQQLDANVQKWLLPRLPFITDIVALLLKHAAGQGQKGNETVQKERRKENKRQSLNKKEPEASGKQRWTEEECVWVRLRAARTILWFAKVMPDEFAGQGVYLHALLAKFQDLDTVARDKALARNRLLTEVSLLQCLSTLPFQAKHWKEEALAQLLSIRARVMQFKLRPAAQTIVLEDIDSTLSSVVLTLGGVNLQSGSSGTKNSSELEAQEYALAILSSVHTEAAARRVARVVFSAAKMQKGSPVDPQYSSLILSAFALMDRPEEQMVTTHDDDGKADSNDAQPLAVLMIVSLLHSLSNPGSLFTQQIQSRLEKAELGPALLFYAKHILGADVSTPQDAGADPEMELHSIPRDSPQTFGKILGLQQGLFGLTVGCLSPIKNVAEPAKWSRKLFSSKMLKKHGPRLLSQAKTVSPKQAGKSAQLLTRLVWTKLLAQNDAGVQLESDFAFCFELLGVLLVGHPNTVANSLLWIGPTKIVDGSTRVLKPAALTSLVSLFDSAASLIAHQTEEGHSEAFRHLTGHRVLAQNCMVTSMLDAMCSLPAGSEREKLASILLCARRSLGEEIESARLEITDELLFNLCQSFLKQQGEQQKLCLLVMRLMPLNANCIKMLLDLAKDNSSADMNDTLKLVFTRLCEPPDGQVISGTRLLAMILDKCPLLDLIEPFMAGNVDQDRVKTLAMLATHYEPVAFAALSRLVKPRSTERIADRYETFLPLLRACVGPQGCISERVQNLLDDNGKGFDFLVVGVKAFLAVCEKKGSVAPDVERGVAIIEAFPNTIAVSGDTSLRSKISLTFEKAHKTSLKTILARLDSSDSNSIQGDACALSRLALVLARTLKEQRLLAKVCRHAATMALDPAIQDMPKLSEMWIRCAQDALSALHAMNASERKLREVFSLVARSIQDCGSLLASANLVFFSKKLTSLWHGKLRDSISKALLNHASLAHAIRHDPNQNEAQVSLCILRVWVSACEEAAAAAAAATTTSAGNESLCSTAFRAECHAAARAAYRGTLSERDCLLRRALFLFEVAKTGFDLASTGFAIGSTAESLDLSAGNVQVPPKLAGKLSSPDMFKWLLEERFEWLVSVDFRPSLGALFPLYRSLTPESELPYCLGQTMRVRDDTEAADASDRATVVRGKRRDTMSPNPYGKRRRLNTDKHCDSSSSGPMETYDELFFDKKDTGMVNDGNLDDGESDSESLASRLSSSSDGSTNSSGDSESEEEGPSRHGSDPADNALAAQALQLIKQTPFSSKALDPSFWLPLIEQYLTLHALVAKLPDEAGSAMETDDMQDWDTDEQGDKEEDVGPLSNPSVAIGFFPARRLLESGLVSYLVWSLSSRCPPVRSKAGACLQLFGQLTARETIFRERHQVILVLRSLRGALEQEAGKVPPVPPLLANFVDRALLAMFTTASPVFKHVNRFLLQRPWLDIKSVPLFYEVFNSGSNNSRNERAWMVHLIVSGQRVAQDVDLLAGRHVYSALMSFFLTRDVCDFHMQQRVVDIFLQTCKVGDFGVRKLLRSGLIVWATGAIRYVCDGRAQPKRGTSFDASRVQVALVLCKVLQFAAASFTQDSHVELVLMCDTILRFALPLTRKRCDIVGSRQLLEAIVVCLRSFVKAATSIEICSSHLVQLVACVPLSETQEDVKLLGQVIELISHVKCAGLFNASEWKTVINWALTSACARPELGGEALVQLAKWIASNAAQSETFKQQALCEDHLRALRFCPIKGNRTSLLDQIDLVLGPSDL